LTVIYKLAPRTLWNEAEAAGVFLGAPVDLADGYIHFSTADTLEATANKWFADVEDVLVIGIDESKLNADELKYEVSRGGALFPHLYGPMPLNAVTGVVGLDRQGNEFDFAPIWEFFSSEK